MAIEFLTDILQYTEYFYSAVSRMIWRSGVLASSRQAKTDLDF